MRLNKNDREEFRKLGHLPEKNQLKRLINKIQGSQFGHLYKRMFTDTKEAGT